jgi:hypothetical protein
VEYDESPRGLEDNDYEPDDENWIGFGVWLIYRALPDASACVTCRSCRVGTPLRRGITP